MKRKERLALDHANETLGRSEMISMHACLRRAYFMGFEEAKKLMRAPLFALLEERMMPMDLIEELNQALFMLGEDEVP